MRDDGRWTRDDASLVSRPPSFLVLVAELPNQSDIVEVHLACAARGRAAFGADADGDRIDIREIHAHKSLQVDDPFFPSAPLRCSKIIVINHRRAVESDEYFIGGIPRRASEPQ